MVTRTLAPERLTERERQRLVSRLALMRTPQCDDGVHHRSCGGTVAFGIDCGCVCHAMAVHSNGTRI